jgi:amidase
MRLAVKDCIDVVGLPTTVGSQLVAELAVPASADAAVVAAARRAGASIVGKTNLTELCWSAAGMNDWSGTPVNPLDPLRVPGGSSSGSAVAVAVGEADVALGTDTGGSVRIPAACCGVVGLKTTWGRIPLDGVYPLAPSLDTVGPLGATVAAVELGMRLIDPGFVGLGGGFAELAVGRMRHDGLVDPATDAAVDRALAAAGVTVTDLPAIDPKAVDAVADVLIDAEGYRANLALLPYIDRLSEFVQRCLAAGAAFTDEEIAGAYRGQESVAAWFAERFAHHPFLAMATLVGAPPRLDGGHRIPLTLLTTPANVAGLPAISLPVPGGPAGLPASLQLIGPPNSEPRLLSLAQTIEAALPAPEPRPDRCDNDPVGCGSLPQRSDP